MFTRASIIQVSGDVSGNWNTDTVQVIDDLLVPNNLTLTINPGVKVIFDGHYIFKVAGQVLASGLGNNPILFTVSDTTGFYNLQTSEGAWNGFWFEHLAPNNDSTIFEYCNFEYGKAVGEDTTYWHGGAMCVREFSRLRITNCNFSNNKSYKNGGAVYGKLANIKIEHCAFENNMAGTQEHWGYGGGVCFEYSDAQVYRNYFSQNSSTGVGGGLSSEYSKLDIESNIFADNYSAIGGGVCFLRSEDGNSIVNNLVVDNEAQFFGGGVAFLRADILFTNNTIVNNLSPYGGGMYFNDESAPVLKNCIIWDNTSIANDGWQVYIWDLYSAPEFYYCDIKDGQEGFSGSGGSTFIGVYENNKELIPEFVGMGEHPYNLSENSPCKNSGTPDTTGLLLPERDLASNLRFQDGNVDMGAYEVQGNAGLQNASNVNVNVNVWPNPITVSSKINLNVFKPTKIQFSILDSQGKEITEITELLYSEGKHQIPLSVDILNPGFYILKVSAHYNRNPQLIKLIVQ